MSQHLREEKPPKIEKLPTDKARLELPSFLPLIRLFPPPHKQTNTTKTLRYITFSSFLSNSFLIFLYFFFTLVQKPYEAVTDKGPV